MTSINPDGAYDISPNSEINTPSEIFEPPHDMDNIDDTMGEMPVKTQLRDTSLFGVLKGALSLQNNLEAQARWKDANPLQNLAAALCMGLGILMTVPFGIVTAAIGAAMGAANENKYGDLKEYMESKGQKYEARAEFGAKLGAATPLLIARFFANLCLGNVNREIEGLYNAALLGKFF